MRRTWHLVAAIWRVLPLAAVVAVPAAAANLTINPTWDSSITGNANSAQIQGAITSAINDIDSLFTDPITVQILFRYSPNQPNGNPFPVGIAAQSNWVFYRFGWNAYMTALTTDYTNSPDPNRAIAQPNLPGAALSTNVKPSSANGRAIGLNTPPAMCADSSVVAGCPYDGIVTLNSTDSFSFTRPVGATSFDATRFTEHEIDEVLGFGSFLTLGGTDLRPQDLFSYSSAGTRNTTTTGTRYFSIDGGNTNIVSFNQTSGGDFGDWISGSCPQANAFVQNAVSCAGQSSDVTWNSPEGMNLDVIGYDLAAPEPAATILALSGIGLLAMFRRRGAVR